METVILELKKKLYLALLHLGRDEITDSEIELMYTLSIDPDIQKFITKSLEQSEQYYNGE